MLSIRRILAFLCVGFVITVLAALTTDRMRGGSDDQTTVGQSMVWLFAGLLWLGAAWWLFAPRRGR